MSDQRILNTIYQAVDEINLQLPEEEKLTLAAETILWSKSGGLDSMGLVNLIVLTEEKVEEEFGKAINLADQNAMAQENSPFQSVQTLAEYIASLLNGKNEA